MSSGPTIDEIRSMIPAIRSEDKSLRLRSLSNLHLIARALGPQRTRDELIPFTVDAPDHDDAGLTTLGTVLGQMLKEVGGPGHIQSLFGGLSFLCENEDARIRNNAIDSLIHLAGLLSPAARAASFVPFIRSLCDDAWYPLRCAATSLLCRLYTQLHDADSSVLDNLLTALSSDPIILVKRSLVQSIRFLCEVAKPPDILFTVITALAKDESASVAVEIPPLLALLGPAHRAFVLSAGELILTSPVWQARAVLVAHLDSIFATNPPSDFIRRVTLFQPLPAIRAAIARQIPFLYTSLALENFSQFAGALISDPDPAIRTAAATALGAMPASAASLVDGWLASALADRDPDVQLAALRSVSSSGLGVEATARHIGGVIAGGNWRTKITIAHLLPAIAKALDADALAAVIRTLFADDADAVKRATIDVFPALVAQLGEEWRAAVLVPAVREIAHSIDYQLRKAAVTAAITLGLHEGLLADVIAAAAKDPVANVRVVLARDLPRNSNVLAALRGDSDPDVAFYASKA